MPMLNVYIKTHPLASGVMILPVDSPGLVTCNSGKSKYECNLSGLNLI